MQLNYRLQILAINKKTKSTITCDNSTDNAIIVYIKTGELFPSNFSEQRVIETRTRNSCIFPFGKCSPSISSPLSYLEFLESNPRRLTTTLIAHPYVRIITIPFVLVIVRPTWSSPMNVNSSSTIVFC